LLRPAKGGKPLSDNRKSNKRDYKFSQYFSMPDGSDIRVVSYRTDEGYFFRVEINNNESAVASAGPYETQLVAMIIGTELLFEELNSCEAKRREHDDDLLERGR
jgi:hypothetical protein